jgi:two-component system, NtrC family, sensor kinase
MQRRGGSGQASKGQRAARPKAREASNASPKADLQEQLDRRTRELEEALQQQTATSEVLRVISSSPSDLNPVFETILANATRLCGAKFGMVNLSDGDLVRVAAVYNVPAAFVAVQNVPFPLHPQSGHAQIVRTKRPVQISDIRKMPPYLEGDPRLVALADVGGARTILGVPMLKEGELLGTIVIYRQEVRPFSDEQIALLESFAAQAALLNELRQRTDDLSESLEQQTATSEVLSVIGQSRTDVQPVFDAVAESAARLCESFDSAVWRRENDQLLLVAHHGAISLTGSETFLPLVRGSVGGRSVLDGRTVHIADVQTEGDEFPRTSENARRQGYRTILSVPLMRDGVAIGAIVLRPDRGQLALLAGSRSQVLVPMLKENNLIGAIVTYRQEVKPFTDKQIELVKNFAAQAVIAIENTRLLSELRESLQQQTATADVLKVISGSPGTLDPVFSTMLAKATELCEASYGTLWLHEEDGYRAVAMHGDLPPVWLEQWRSGAIYRAGPDRPMARAAEGRQSIQIADMRTDPSYLQGDPLPVAGVEIAGIRTLLLVPMFKESEHVGLIAIYRTEVLPFTEKQIDLLKNFAAQAVIAIENTRLLNELRESLQQQTATADVLKTISRSPGELEPVFQAMLENAVRICGAKFGVLFLSEGDAFRCVALHGAPAAYAELRQREPVTRVRPETALGRASTVKQPVQVADVRAEPAYHSDPSRADFLNLTGARTVIAVPILKEDNLVGAVLIYRQEVQPFTDKQIELITNFAAQAVIAIENTRLLNELRESLQQQTATADVLKVISRSTFDLKAVLNTLVESATRLCEADNGNIARPQGNDFYQVEAFYGMSAALTDELTRKPLKAGKGSLIGRTALNRAPVHILDVQKDRDYEFHAALKIGAPGPFHDGICSIRGHSASAHP